MTLLKARSLFRGGLFIHHFSKTKDYLGEVSNKHKILHNFLELGMGRKACKEDKHFSCASFVYYHPNILDTQSFFSFIAHNHLYMTVCCTIFWELSLSFINVVHDVVHDTAFISYLG